eukprot:CAMPEP_0172519270 /NCGR_PEP_ID=MMETSP1066-20121228/291318_1 /TAXON_ID=671091 /ORGANISM="Coscinodiscus wailesii, Strain CCMP2513" /LENGTH=60 /DNA_ID=CAMNT_0013301831 /DNA_START=201 /DNA_END=383 /DNA_ORIENTATION=+
MNEEAWNKLLETIPDFIALHKPAEFETYDEIMPNDLVHSMLRKMAPGMLAKTSEVIFIND